VDVERRWLTRQAVDPLVTDPNEETAVPRNRPTAGQVLLRFTLGSGPLKRGSDRLQFLARVLLVCTVLAAVPISLAVATATYTQAGSEAAAAAEDQHRVIARLLDDAPAPPDEGWVKGATTQGIAVWTDPAGIEHRVLVSVPTAAKAGHKASIWIDEDGNRTPPPLNADDIRGRAVGEGFATLCGVSAIGVGAYLWAGALLDRSRSRRWEAEWATVEPVWTRTVP
jgi:hypothetical protein